jgi:hypothetical protein
MKRHAHSAGFEEFCKCPCHVWMAMGLASQNITLGRLSVQPCVRSFGAVRMTVAIMPSAGRVGKSQYERPLQASTAMLACSGRQPADVRDGSF